MQLKFKELIFYKWYRTKIIDFLKHEKIDI